MQDLKNGYSSAVVVDMAGKRGLVKVESNTLLFSDLQEEGDNPRTLYRQEKNIKLFECLVTEPGRLYVVVVGEDDVISGVALGKGSWSKLFEPYKALGVVKSLSLASGLNNDLNLFFASAGYKGAKLHHYRADQGALKKISVLTEGSHDDFGALRSISDLWGSFNLFYLTFEKGVPVLRHQYFVPFSKAWSAAVTLYGPEQGEVENFSALVDNDNNIYLALFLKGAKKGEIIFLKREMGGWPKGGWQRAILISQEERRGIPVIDFFRKGYMQILFYSEGESKLFVWREGEVKSLQKKELDLEGRSLVRLRTSAAARAEYMLAEENMEGEISLSVASPGEAEEDICPSPDGQEQEEEEEAKGNYAEDGSENVQEEGLAAAGLEKKQRDERDVFVRQAVMIMQAKADLEASLRKKEKEMARQKQHYENKVKLLRDQLASRTEAFRSLESKLSRQEAAALGMRAEQKSWEKEINQLKKETWELKDSLKKKDQENRELTIKMDGLRKQLEEMEKRSATSEGIMGRLGRILKK